MFVDQALIEVRAGKGGDGSASFRREKYIPKGGPDGGDGGDGGHVYLRVKDNMHGLAGLAGTKYFEAESGERGHGKRQYGPKGEHLTIEVPPGTIVYEIDARRETLDERGRSVKLPTTNYQLQPDATAAASEHLLLDTATLETDQTFLLAKGGRGGLGNVHFARSDHQTPKEFTPGAPGQHKQLRLEVRHIADVGLIGLPNVGKSTFLARVTDAKPKVANYPFTTLEPHLGVAEYGNARFVIADLPGLIEGASGGKGLGIQFLRHIARTKVLLHLLDAQSENPLADYKAIRKELGAFDKELLERPEVIALSRIDTLDVPAQKKLLAKLTKKLGSVLPLSSQTGQGVNEILSAVSTLIQASHKVIPNTSE